MKRWARRGAMAAALGAAALLGGCADNSGPQDVSGAWRGSLTLQLAGGAQLGGGLTLSLDQTEDFASGGALWAPINEIQAIAGPVDGISVSWRLIFRCAKSFETATLAGTIGGDRIEFTGASGRACTLGGEPAGVEDASGSLDRTRDDLPL